MKRTSIILLFAILMLGCKKGNTGTSRCPNYLGGVTAPYTAVFYQRKDFGGTTVQIKEAGGNIIFSEKLSYYIPSGNVDCQSSMGVVKFPLGIATEYTYHAFSNTKTWDGELFSCQERDCVPVELK